MIRVVIADDEVKVCQLIVGLADWKALDMEVVGTAHDGVQALELVETLEPDLLITDIRMPGYDGLELISRAKQSREDLEIIIISGHRHFEYARTAIQHGVGEYLLKPVNQKELTGALERAVSRYQRRMEQMTNEGQLRLRRKNDIEKLRDGLFTDYLLSETDQALSLERINTSFHYSFREGCFLPVILKLDGTNGVHHNLDILFNKAMSILSGIPEEGWDLGLYCSGTYLYCLINGAANAANTVGKRLRAALDEMLLQKDIFDPVSVTMGCGNVMESAAGLQQEFREAKAAVMERLVQGTGRIIEPVTRTDSREAVSAMLSEFNRRLNTAIEVLDLEEALDGVDRLRQQAMAVEGINGADLHKMALDACNVFAVLLRQHGCDDVVEENLYDRFCREADCVGTAEELLQLLRGCVSQTLDRVIQQRQQSQSKPVRQVKQYILQHYGMPLTLEEMGRMVGFSAAYFSTLFKKETGTGFLEYLTGVRMDKAKELLRESDLSVSAICEQVGYSDLKHFTKSFKKITGLKPNEFRKLYS